LFLLLVGCGVPGEPLPPLLEIPAAINDLTAVQVGDHIEVTWSVPHLTTEGTRVRELDRMDIYGVFLSGMPGLAILGSNLASSQLSKPTSLRRVRRW